jgi:hypothetical protein
MVSLRQLLRFFIAFGMNILLRKSRVGGVDTPIQIGLSGEGFAGVV